jgi:hypothetical protein
MSKKISELPLYSGSVQPSGDVPISINGTTYRINPLLLINLSLKADLIDGKIPSSQLPSYVDDVIEVANFASLPTTGETGKIYVTLDNNHIFRWGGSSYIEITDNTAVWGAITGNLTDQTDLINALNGKEPLIVSGTSSQYYRGDKTWQTLDKFAVGLGNVDNTSDANKPVSTAQQTALNGKEPTISVGTSSQYYRGDKTWQTLDKTAVGLPNVDNTSDVNKPVSTATQTALNGKFNNPTGNTTQYIAGDGSLITFPTVLDSGNLVCLVRNQSGATIVAGSLVYISGGSGNKPLITLSQGNNEPNSSRTFGMVRNDISNNSNGYVVISGQVTDLNTSTYAEGTVLYLSPTTAGGFTSTKPSAPNHLVYIGEVIYSHSQHGTIQARIQNGYELDELHNVALSSLVDKGILTYEFSTSLWKNKSLGTIIGGTSSQFVKGDGSLDSNVYALDSAVVKLTGAQTIAGVKTFSNAPILSSVPTVSNVLKVLVRNASTGEVSEQLLTFSKTVFFNSTSPLTASIFSLDNPPVSNDNSLKLLDSAIYIGTDSSTWVSDGSTYTTYSGSGSTVAGTPFYLSGTTVDAGTNKTNPIKRNGSVEATAFKTTGGTLSQFIKGDGTLDSNVYAKINMTNGYIPIYSSSFNQFNNSLIYSDGTSVMIGTSGTTGAKLHVVETSATQGGMLLQNTNASNNGTLFQMSIRGTGKLIDASDATSTIFSVSNSGGGYFKGNTGIGTASPANILTVEGGNQISHRYTSGGGSTYAVYFGQFDASGNVSINNAANADLWIGTNNSRSMTFKSGGNVGIGLNSPDNGKLTILKNSTYNSYSGAGLSIQSNSNNVYTELQFGADDTINCGYVQSVAKNTSYTSKALLLNPNGGNVSIGTISSNALLQIGSGASTGATNSLMYLGGYSTGVSQLRYIMNHSGSANAGIGTPSNGGILFGYGLVDGTVSSEWARFTTSGNFGIGTISPNRKLEINTTSNGIPLRLQTDGSNTGIEFLGGSGVYNFFVGKQYNVSNAFEITPSTTVGGTTFSTPALVVTSGGVVCVGTTSAFDSGIICSDGGTSYVPYTAKIGTTSNSTQIFFRNPNGVVGSISTSGSVTLFNSMSDYRLKQDLKNINGLDLVSKIKVYDYEWKSDKSRSYGVLAHELQELVPQAVTGEKDGEQMQSVDYSKLVPILVQAVKELKAEIEILKN